MASYGTREGMELLFGEDNIEEWGNRNNGLKTDPAVMAKVAANIADALARATTHIDSRLYLGPYTVPFEETYPDLIIDICNALAGSKLYDARRITDKKETADQSVDLHREDAYDWISAIRAGTMKIPTLTASITYPAAVNDET